jgi:hypothetical protein
MRLMTLVKLLVVGCCLVRFQFALAADERPDELARILTAKDFWETAGRSGGQKWTDAEQKQLRVIQAESTNPVTRLRANKVLVDLADTGRVKDKADEAKVIECFRYLESHVADGAVNKLCANEGFTHYSGPARSGGTFLIEHVSPGFNGGLNLKWDAAKTSVGEVKAWGDVEK